LVELSSVLETAPTKEDEGRRKRKTEGNFLPVKVSPNPGVYL